jgi:NAD(P) transhydrogenase subunit alpha
VAATPESIQKLRDLGFQVIVEKQAGAAAGFTDEAYQKAGATIAPNGEAWQAEVVVKVRPPAPEEVARTREGATLISFMQPERHPELPELARKLRLSTVALERIPRITRAQKMDVLSSMANLAGYRAVIEAAQQYQGFFGPQMTAAGATPPARVLVIGAGVAGLQAIATARRLGAVVEAYDVRPATREQIQSLGAKYVDLALEAQDAQDEGGYARAMDESFYRRQREVMARVVAASDVVISTAAIPGQKAPVLITAEMVGAMRPGSVIVDVAAEQGGNCGLTEPGHAVVHGGVTVLGPVNLAAAVPNHASLMHARNVANFLALIVKDRRLAVDLEDQIVRETLVARGGEVVHPRLRQTLGLPALTAAAT